MAAPGLFCRSVARAALALIGSAASLTAGRPAQAQPKDNHYAVDLFQGPLLAPTRVSSMGGAYAGYAEGIAGFVANAASPAVREPFSLSWLDADIDASFSVPFKLFENNDFDNSGEFDADYSSFLYLSAGSLLQLGPFGAGFFGDLERYTLTFPPDDAETVVTVGRYHVLFGWQFLDNQLAIGAGARALTLGIGSAEAELTIAGVAPQIGILLKPNWTPFRFGATYRHPVSAATSIGSGATIDAAGVERAGRLVVPDRVELPWEVELGTAVQVGARPLNPAWIDPNEHERELRRAYAIRARERRQQMDQQLAAVPPGVARQRLRTHLDFDRRARDAHAAAELGRDLDRLKEERRARASNWPRESLLLDFDLLVTGPVSGAISLERFLGQGQHAAPGAACHVAGSGAEVNFSPRFGVEMEPVKRYVHTRLGSYYEPPRYDYTTDECNGRVGRQHFTFGADVKLFDTTWWGLVPEVTYKLQGYGDMAPRYQSFGLGLGVWH